MQKQITTQALPMNATEQVFKPEAWTGQMTALQDQMMSMFGMKKP
jgi:hypothetical protein